MKHIPSPLNVKVKFYSDDITDFPRPSTTIAFHFYNIRELIHLDLTRYLKSEINIILNSSTSKTIQSYIISRLLNDNKLFYLATKTIVQNFPDSMLLIKNNTPLYIDLISLIYPRAYDNIVSQWAEKFNISPLWIWAVMRQESRFNPRAVSVVNAKGIMQVMDSTAQKMLKKMGDNPYYYNPFDVDDNVKVGSFYLKFLFEKFKGDPILAIAAYNAGEDRVASWLTKKYTCVDSFVEKIPFPETKKYVKKVISNWMVYNFLSRMPYYEFSKNH